MRVADVMTAPVLAVGATDSLKFVEIVMEWKHIRHLPVVDEDNHVVGLITHRDLMRAHVSSIADVNPHDQDVLLRGIPVQGVMRTDVRTVSPEDDAREVARAMLEEKIGCFPVVEDGKLVGILTEADFVRAFLEQLD